MIYCVELVAGAIEDTCSYVAPSCHNNNNNVTYGSASELPMQIHSQVRLYVVERSTGEALKTKYMSADTFYCLHHINAYEDKGNAAWL